MIRPVPAAVFDLPTTSDLARKSTCAHVRSRISFAKRLPVDRHTAQTATRRERARNFTRQNVAKSTEHGWTDGKRRARLLTRPRCLSGWLIGKATRFASKKTPSLPSTRLRPASSEYKLTFYQRAYRRSGISTKTTCPIITRLIGS